MSIWQHTTSTDHLLRRAEGQIERSRPGSKASFAAGGKGSVSLIQEAKADYLNSILDVPTLGAMTGGFMAKN